VTGPPAYPVVGLSEWNARRAPGGIRRVPFGFVRGSGYSFSIT
jgi:hypothetical protein